MRSVFKYFEDIYIYKKFLLITTALKTIILTQAQIIVYLIFVQGDSF